MVWGGRHLKIRDICMDLEPCFKVNNLVVIQLKNTKLGQMANLNMIFYMVCQFINWIKFATHPSPLLDFKVANEYTFRADLHVIRCQMLCDEIAAYQ